MEEGRKKLADGFAAGATAVAVPNEQESVVTAGQEEQKEKEEVSDESDVSKHGFLKLIVFILREDLEVFSTNLSEMNRFFRKDVALM